MHILRADQEPVARVFAGKGRRQVRRARLGLGRRRAASWRATIAYLRCRRSATFERYDHSILIGDIEGGRVEGGEPLLYARRRMDWRLES